MIAQACAAKIGLVVVLRNVGQGIGCPARSGRRSGKRARGNCLRAAARDRRGVADRTRRRRRGDRDDGAVDYSAVAGHAAAPADRTRASIDRIGDSLRYRVRGAALTRSHRKDLGTVDGDTRDHRLRAAAPGYGDGGLIDIGRGAAVVERAWLAGVLIADGCASIELFPLAPVPIAIGGQHGEVLLAGVFDRVGHGHPVQRGDLLGIDAPGVRKRLAQRRAVAGRSCIEFREPTGLLRGVEDSKVEKRWIDVVVDAHVADAVLVTDGVERAARGRLHRQHAAAIVAVPIREVGSFVHPSRRPGRRAHRDLREQIAVARALRVEGAAGVQVVLLRRTQLSS